MNKKTIWVKAKCSNYYHFLSKVQYLNVNILEIKYELYGMICYQGNNADHAFALIKVYGTNQWYEFNDQKVDKKGGDEVLKNEQLLSAKFNWPALFFYRKLK